MPKKKNEQKVESFDEYIEEKRLFYPVQVKLAKGEEFCVLCVREQKKKKRKKVLFFVLRFFLIVSIFCLFFMKFAPRNQDSNRVEQNKKKFYFDSVKGIFRADFFFQHWIRFQNRQRKNGKMGEVEKARERERWSENVRVQKCINLTL